ncbi:MAG: hypothetical protein GWN87_05605 [Desulfuromonadales bacterium]|nr:hypothetical protein [Desulfuromonadales bacterium]NIS40068.1 hypothetical protein [Desulfuromonadales bacterium]
MKAERPGALHTSILTYGFILFSTALLWSGTVLAAEEESPRKPPSKASGTFEEEKEEEEGPGAMKRFLLWSDAPHRGVSNRLDTLSRSLDSIFGEERIYEEATETHLQMRGGVVIERSGSLSFEHDLSLKVDLPKTERRVKLVFESEDDDEDPIEGEGDGSTGAEGLQEEVDKDYSAALQFFIRESRRWNVSVGPGARLRTPPDFFARIRVRRSQDLGSTWQARLTERLTEFLRIGLESRTTLEFERRTGKEQLFRLSSRVLWREEFQNDNVHLSQGAQLFKRLTKRDSIAYGAAVVWQTKPNLHHQLYVADIRWRRRIHKKWLFVEIKPEARFEREHDFRFDPSLTLSLEVLFGKNYLK